MPRSPRRVRPVRGDVDPVLLGEVSLVARDLAPRPDVAAMLNPLAAGTAEPLADVARRYNRQLGLLAQPNRFRLIHSTCPAGHGD